MIKTTLIFIFMCLGLGVARAGGHATVVCGNTGVVNSGPLLQITYSTGSDAGTAGLFWLGVISPDQTAGAVLTPQGWQTYSGGLYPFQARYEAGLSASITLTIPFPGGAQDTGAYVGYNVYAGHGIYSKVMSKKVAERRASLNLVKPDMIAKGRWQSQFDTDDNYVWSLIQKDMTDNQKYGAIFSIPFIDCAQTSGQWGQS